MTVTETLMGDGRWSLRLRPDAPGFVVERLLDRRSLLKIYPTRIGVDSVPNVTPTYCGIRLGSDEWGEVHGAGLSWLLGTPLATDGALGHQGFEGPALASWPTGSALPAWVTACSVHGILDGADGFFGAVATVNLTLPSQGEIARGALEAACRYALAEWLITPDRKLHAGLRSDLFGATTQMARVVVAPDSAGFDSMVAGLTLAAMKLAVSDEQQADICRATSGGVTSDQTSSSGIFHPGGAQFARFFYVGDYPTTAERDQARQAAFPAKTGLVRSFDIETAEFHPLDRWSASGSLVYPGATIGVYDPARNVYDTTNPMEYRGRTIYPVAVRAVALDWPVTSDLAVYLDNRHNTGSGTPPEGQVVTDLTDYVEFETGTAKWTVGQLPERLDGTRRLVAP